MLLEKLKNRWALRNAGSKPFNPEKRVKLLRAVQKWVPVLR